MAGDWIKMRPSLLTSPKVNGIARILEESPEAGRALSTGFNGPMREIVSRNVMRNVTVSALLTVWGAANEHTADGVFTNADLSDIDDMVGIPGFGEAMQAVGWAVEDRSASTVTLPNFGEYNTCGKDRAAEKNAERQRRFREKKQAQQAPESNGDRNVTHNVTSNDREEKRREEKETPPARKRASVLPDGFGISDAVKAWAAKHGYGSLDRHLEHFIGYAKSSGKRYADWDQALQNAIRDDWAGVRTPKRGAVVAHPSAATPDEAILRRISDANGGEAVQRLPDGRYRCGVRYYRPNGAMEIMP